jgi:glutamine amidotransferase
MVTIIDYGMGNTGSVMNALRFLGTDSVISRDKEEIEKSSHIILPGVGAFGDAIESLRTTGLVEILNKEVLEKKKPFLGICLGMQLIAEIGEEGGINNGLGWIRGKVRKINSNMRLPHIGWNDISWEDKNDLSVGLDSNSFYFVHSYCFWPNEIGNVIGWCEYGERFPVAVKSGNIFGVQFHPEKSQKSGLRILENFLNIHA